MSNGSNGAQLLVRHLEAEGVEYVYIGFPMDASPPTPL
jgi:hypothetical protein